MTTDDSTATPKFDDGCVGEHSPASNLGCEMSPAQDDGRRGELAAVTEPAEPGWRPFDPQAAAADAPEGESPLATVVGQFGGYVSGCWDNLAGAGVFEQERAVDAVQRLVRWLEQRGVTGTQPGGDTHHHHEPTLVPSVAEYAEGDRLLLVSPSGGEVGPDELGRIVGEIEAVLDDTERRVSALQGMSIVVLKGGGGL